MTVVAKGISIECGTAAVSSYVSFSGLIKTWGKAKINRSAFASFSDHADLVIRNDHFSKS